MWRYQDLDARILAAERRRAALAREYDEAERRMAQERVPISAEHRS